MVPRKQQAFRVPSVAITTDGAKPKMTHWWLNAWHKGYLIKRMDILVLSLILLIIPNTSPCPVQCECKTSPYPGLTVECVRKQISTIPSIPPRTVHLRLSDNSISHIGNQTLARLLYLTTLYLDHNAISTIDSGAFYNLPKLRVLSLRRNKLTSLEPHIFSHLHQLELLDLGQNNILLLHAKTFIQNSLLINLSLDDNALSTIANGSFQSLHNLQRLTLEKNPVARLHSEVFHPLHSLIELDLSEMHLAKMPQDLFRNQQYLQTIDLAKNKMMTVLPKPFQHLKKLIYLNISGNPLHCDCRLLPLHNWLTDVANHLKWDTKTVPVCQTPEELADFTLFEVPSDNLTCSFLTPGSAVIRKKLPIEDPNKSLLGPLVYDPMMGWYTASTLTGMLVLFLICVALDKLKRRYYKWRRIKRKLKEQHQYEFCADKSHLDGELINLKTFNRFPPRQSSRDSTKTHRSTQSAPICNSTEAQKPKLTPQNSFDSRLFRYPPPQYRQQSQDSQSSLDSNKLLPLLQHSQLMRQASGESYWTGQSSQDSGSITRQSSQESGPSRPLSVHGQFIRAASFDARSRTPSVDNTGTDISAIPFRLGLHGHLMRASSFDARAIMRQPSIEGGQVLKAYSQEAFRRQMSIESNDSFTRQGSFDSTCNNVPPQQSNLKPASGLSQSHESPLGKSQMFGPIFVKRKGSDTTLRRQSSTSQDSAMPKVPISRPEKLPLKPYTEALALPRAIPARPVSPLVRHESLGAHLKQTQSPMLQQTIKSPHLIKQRSHESPFLQVQPRRHSLVRQRSHELPFERPVSPLAQPPRDLSFPQSCHEELQIKMTPRGNTLTVSPLRHHMTPPTSPGVHCQDFTGNTLVVPCRAPSSPTPKRMSRDSLTRDVPLHLPEIVIQVFDTDSPSYTEHCDPANTNFAP